MQTVDTNPIGDVVHASLPQGLRSASDLDAVLAMSREIFPGEVIARQKSDPEIAGETYYSIRVQAHGSVAEITAQDGLWHQRLLEIAPEPVGLYRLSMCP